MIVAISCCMLATGFRFPKCLIDPFENWDDWFSWLSLLNEEGWSFFDPPPFRESLLGEPMRYLRKDDLLENPVFEEPILDVPSPIARLPLRLFRFCILSNYYSRFFMRISSVAFYLPYFFWSTNHSDSWTPINSEVQRASVFAWKVAHSLRNFCIIFLFKLKISSFSKASTLSMACWLHYSIKAI